MDKLRQIWNKIFNRHHKEIIMNLHSHEWVSKAITYAAPRRDAFSVTQDHQLLEKIILGLTTISWECSTCQEFRIQEMLGSERIQLDELLDKADLYGPQYLERGQSTFVIEKRPISNQTPMGLPIR